MNEENHKKTKINFIIKNINFILYPSTSYFTISDKIWDQKRGNFVMFTIVFTQSYLIVLK